MRNDQTMRDEWMTTVNTTAACGVSPFLSCLRGEYAGYDIPVPPTGLLIGRDTYACHLIFAATPDVSRYHCRVSYSSRTGYFVVTDLHSLNGVYTEHNRRVPSGEKLVLGPGQVFKLCGESIVFETLLKHDPD